MRVSALGRDDVGDTELAFSVQKFKMRVFQREGHINGPSFAPFDPSGIVIT